MSRQKTLATVSGRHRTKGPQGSGRAFLLALFGGFAVILLLALLVGLQGYRAIADARNASDAQRLAYGSLVNTVKAYDSVDALSLAEYEGNDVLVMTQRAADTAYAVRLFVHEGSLMQQFSLVGAPIDPENAHELFPTDMFSVVYDEGLLSLRTDVVSPCVRMTCPQPSLEASITAATSDAPEAGDA